MNLPDVLFEFDKSRLTPQAERTIRNIADVVRERAPRRRVAIEGHTDSKGTIGYNRKLSMSRARAVADELVHRNISPRRISVRGFGESRPIASNRDASGRQRNRRVEVIIEN